MRKKYRTFGYSEEWTNAIQEYFRLHLLESVESISATTRKNILEVLETAVARGWSIERTVREINSREYLARRARVIVRTETVRAAGYGVMVSAEQYDYEVQKVWISIPDDRRRHSHLELEGQVRDMDQEFLTGLQFPGDPNGALSQVVNCRCVLGLQPKRDAEGNLIPKY
jgi:hypothetical protein